MCVLVIDVGSSSVRVMLFDTHARRVSGAEASIPHRFATSPPGASTIDAVELQHNIERCIIHILQHPEARNIQAVGMDTFAGNILGIDQRGEAVTPVYTYADTRSLPQAQDLSERVDIREIHQRTGCWLHSAYLPARLLWLRQTERKLFSQVIKWVDLGTYLYQRWFGETEIPISYSMASWNGLLDRYTTDWDQTLLDILQIPVHMLSKVQSDNIPYHGLSDDYANTWSRLREVPFYLGIGDGAAANVGSGCIDSTHLSITVGTTAALRMADTAFPKTIPPGLWGYRATEQLHLTGGAMSEGGNVFRWITDTLHIKDLNHVLASREFDSHGLTVLPLLNGERSPGWHNDAVGTIHGIRLSTIADDIAHAMMEAVALRFAFIVDELKPLIADEPVMIASGGVIHHYPAWTQLLADTIEYPIQVTSEEQITARGTAILALNNIGIEPDISPVISHTVEPNAQNTDRMREAKQRQDELYQKLYNSKD